ncbi:hypothetical protein ENLAB_32170 [Enterococcus innesii]|uniref:Leucine-rich repeat domain-containing protein n=2 Tax=Enterococcus innesii TaxID=2839759 RepID=A0ABN6NTY7_9ENTE|nr:leucine-rich repeat domain-containing protein [Enterococcus innesii]BDG69653.1 hypothetical protein ENLAB_32170 [Enterococcus innesii]
MTNGTSQGLFVVVVIVIFGIFVLISYLLFKDNLKPTLANIFTDGLEQSEENLTGIVKEKPINVQSSREDETYLYAKIRDADESKGETEIWVKAYKLDDGTLELRSSSVTDGNYTTGSSDMTGSLVIPDTINGMKIIGLGDGNNISVSNIWSGSSVFANALFDGTLRLPTHLEYIRHTTFEDSKFSGAIAIPKSVKIIGTYAFTNSTFTGELKLPESLTSIGDSAFYNSTFSGELKLPNGLTSIGGSAFFTSTFTGELKLPNGLTSIGGWAFQKSKFTGELKLPDSLTSIGYLAFYSSTFTGTLDVSNVKYIQKDAFSSSKIDKVIRGNVEMSDGSNSFNTSGIHPIAIKLANGNWYDGSNDN